MALSNHLVQRGPREIWHLRWPVPRSKQAAFGRRERVKSLGTSDRVVAARKALPILAQWQAELGAFEEPGSAAPVTSPRVPTELEMMMVATERGFETAIELLDHKRIERGNLDQAGYAALLSKRNEKLLEQTRLRQTDARVGWRSVADSSIAAQRWQLTAGEDKYERFVDLIGVNIIEALRVSIERDSGKPHAQPEAPAVKAGLQAKADRAAKGETLMELFDRYASQRLSEGAKRPDTINQDRKVVERFADFVGANRRVSAITRQDVRDWRDTLAKLPPNYRKLNAYRGLDMRAAAAKAVAEGRGALSAASQNKYLSTVSPVFTWIVSNGFADANPCDGQFLDVKREANPRPPFTVDQLNTIVSSPLFTGFAGPKKEHLSGKQRADDWRFWIPLLCLFTGSRIGEIAQLHVDDVSQQHDDWFIHIRDDAKKGQRTKSGKSRVVAIHRELQRFGFLKFWERQLERAEADGNRQLFPDLKANERDQIGAEPSRFWRKYLTKIGLKEGSDGFGAHSFRHTMADELRAAGYLDAAFGPLILGHSVKSVTGGYGRLPQGTAATLREMMDGVRFEGVAFLNLAITA